MSLQQLVSPILIPGVSACPVCGRDVIDHLLNPFHKLERQKRKVVEVLSPFLSWMMTLNLLSYDIS